LTADRTEVLLDNCLQRVRNDCAEAASEAHTAGCTSAGLIGMGVDLPEYPFGWILDAPQRGIWIESLSHSQLIDKYVDRSFEPCLIICAGCDLSVPTHGDTPVGGRVRLRSGGTSTRIEAHGRGRARVRRMERRAEVTISRKCDRIACLRRPARTGWPKPGLGSREA
jgi:hypothetical protein